MNETPELSDAMLRQIEERDRHLIAENRRLRSEVNRARGALLDLREAAQAVLELIEDEGL